MKRWLQLGLALALLAAGCGSGEIVATSSAPPPDGASQLEALASARQLWEAAPADYTVAALGATLAVRADEVVSLASAETTTIEEVFGTIERSIREGAGVEVDYDPEFGFPTRVLIDRNGDGASDLDFAFSDLAAMPIVETLDELLDSRARWEAQGLDTYRYIFRAECSCPDGGTFDVEVHEGRVTRFVPLDEAATTSRLTPTSIAVAFDDLEEWFSDSADLFDEGILDVDVRMDPELGYPRWFRVEAAAIGEGSFEDPFTMVVTIDLVSPFVPIDDETSGSAPPGEDAQSLLAARTRWEEAALEEYRYLLQMHCECPSAVSGPFEITVRGGKFWSSVGPLEGAGSRPDIIMIDDFFDVIAAAVEAGIDVDVRYDEALGYPLLAIVDTAAVAVDGGMAFSITEFEPIAELGFLLGTAVAGPQCPVVQEPPQPGCEDRPLADVLVVIEGDSLGGVPISLSTDRNGGLFIALEPGEYLVTGQPVAGTPGTPDPVVVSIRSGVQEEIVLVYDTGIR